ncbi:MAG TPA: DUF1697 domain-containing protein [Ilumatobacteraceae bacterium]|nr:DUF1697 domain-containing protein [Ilumatobacteraceae bacterium]
MTTWVVLLRGVNVGGANRVPMTDLRHLVTSLGHSDVVTYIQSGNLLLTSSRKDRATIAAEIGDGIESSFGLAVTAILRTPQQLRASVKANPFSAEATADAANVHIMFLSDVPKREFAAQLDPERFGSERFALIGSELFLHYPHGAGRSKMNLDYFEKRLHVRGTARNLNTVAKLIELAKR